MFHSWHLQTQEFGMNSPSNKACWAEQFESRLFSKAWALEIHSWKEFWLSGFRVKLSKDSFWRFGISRCNWGRCTWNPSVHHQTMLMREMLFCVLAQYCPQLIHSNSYVYKHPWRQMFAIYVPLKAKKVKFVKHFWKADIFFWGGAKGSVWARGCACIS